MYRLYLKSLFEKKWLFLALLFFAVFFIWLYVSLFKTISFATSIDELVKILPEKVLKSLNIEIGALNTFEGFIGNEKHSVINFLLASILGISLGGGYLSGEIEKGTIYLPLSLPVKRTKFFLSKLSAGVTVMTVFCGTAILSVFPLTWIYDIPIHNNRFLIYAFVTVLFGLAFFAFSLFLSSIFSDRNKVAFIAGGTLILMYVLNIIAGIKDSLEFLKYFSIFYYFNIVDILVRNDVKSITYIVFIGAFFLFSILGFFAFSKRDINFS